MLPTTKNNIPKENLLHEAFDALIDRLGTEKALRVWQFLVPSGGDYVEERKRLFANKSVSELEREIRKFNRKK